MHPFDDVHVIAGQGTIGLEILDQISDIGKNNVVFIFVKQVCSSVSSNKQLLSLYY